MPVPAPAATPTPTAPISCMALKRNTEPTRAAPTASAAASCPPVPDTMPVTVSSGPVKVVSVVARAASISGSARARIVPAAMRSARFLRSFRVFRASCVPLLSVVVVPGGEAAALSSRAFSSASLVERASRSAAHSATFERR